MTKEQYMKELAQAIKSCPINQQEEILADFNEHFEIALSKGLSEDEVIESLGHVQDFIDDLKIKVETLPATQTSEEISEVMIVSDDCDVQIVENDQLQMNLEGWRSSKSANYDISEYVSEGVYHVEVNRKKQWDHFFNFNSSMTIHLDLPSFIQKVSVENKNGDVELRLNQMQLREAHLHCKNGDIYIEGTLGNCIAHSNLGDVEFKGNVYQADLSSHKGDVYSNVFKGKHVQAHANLGDVGGLIHAEIIEVITDKGDVDIEGEGTQIHAESKAGDVQFNVRADQLEAHTNLGDVSGKVKGKVVSCSTSMGDVECELSEIEYAQCHSQMGDVSVHIGQLEDVMIETNVSLGEVQAKASQMRTMGHCWQKGQAIAKIVLNTQMGDIEIKD